MFNELVDSDTKSTYVVDKTPCKAFWPKERWHFQYTIKDGNMGHGDRSLCMVCWLSRLCHDRISLTDIKQSTLTLLTQVGSLPACQACSRIETHRSCYVWPCLEVVRPHLRKGIRLSDRSLKQ